jgi:hypothetical protein
MDDKVEEFSIAGACLGLVAYALLAIIVILVFI